MTGIPHYTVGTMFVYMYLNLFSRIYFQFSECQAEYWHDPFREAIYKEKSKFLAEINNERVQIWRTFVGKIK